MVGRAGPACSSEKARPAEDISSSKNVSRSCFKIVIEVSRDIALRPQPLEYVGAANTILSMISVCPRERQLMRGRMTLKTSHSHPRQTGTFLERLPVRLLCHLTSPCGRCREAWELAFDDWLDQVERVHHCPIAYIRSLEPKPARHLHIALVATLPLSAHICEELWRGVLGTKSKSAAMVQPFQPGAGGMAYILKTLGSDHEKVEFSPNIDYFDPLGWRPRRSTTSRERRSARRAINPVRWRPQQ